MYYNSKISTHMLQGRGQDDSGGIGPSAIAIDEWRRLGLTEPDIGEMRRYRLQRVLQQIHQHDLAAMLMFDPMNIRYASDSSNMQVWTLHNACRACLVLAGGEIVIWDFKGCDHLSDHLELVKEVRSGASFIYFSSGDNFEQHAQDFARDLKQVLVSYGVADNRRIGVDKIELAGVDALREQGLQIVHGHPLMEHARLVKSAEEIKAMRCALVACENSVAEMHNALRPGISENELWAELHKGNIKRGGEWIETRLLASGPRTNPWYQECGPRIIQAGDLVAFDTDLVGVYGYCVDMSRAWLCGDGAASAEQRELHRVAYEHIQHNIQALRPGLSFYEAIQRSQSLPERYQAQRYVGWAHGVGMCDEYPCLSYKEDWDKSGYDGVLQENMVMSVEAYVGELGGQEGVKLEEQVLLTANGAELMSSYPFDERLMA